MLETPSIKSIEPFIMFDLPETPIEPLELELLQSELHQTQSELERIAK